MPQEFYTICDRGYLARFLVLHKSLVAFAGDFRLRVICMDAVSRATLETLGLANVVPIGVEAIEARDEQLLAVKRSRTTTEYCWTIKPSAALYIFETDPAVNILTYVDTDIMFFDDLGSLYTDSEDQDALWIIPHRAPDWMATDGGLYNAGLIGFRAGPDAFRVLRWWRERCLEWCFDRRENGRFSDQKYLEQWPNLVASVRVVSHPGAGVAPWNVATRRVSCIGGRLHVNDSRVIFYHYSSFKLYEGVAFLARLGILPRAYRVSATRPTLVWSAHPAYQLPLTEENQFWHPYAEHVFNAIGILRRMGLGTHMGFEKSPRRTVARDLTNGIARRLRERMPSRTVQPDERRGSGGRSLV